MRSATAFRRYDGWYFHAESTTTVGVWIGSPPHIKLGIDASTEVLGKAVCEALDGSRQGVPHPTPREGEKTFKPMLDLAGVKTWAAFARDTLCVTFSVDDEWLTIKPWKTSGAKNTFVSISGVSLRIPADSPADRVGETLKEATALCAP